MAGHRLFGYFENPSHLHRHLNTKLMVQAPHIHRRHLPQQVLHIHQYNHNRLHHWQHRHNFHLYPLITEQKRLERLLVWVPHRLVHSLWYLFLLNNDNQLPEHHSHHHLNLRHSNSSSRQKPCSSPNNPYLYRLFYHSEAANLSSCKLIYSCRLHKSY